MSTFGAELRRIRTERNRTLLDLAAAAECTETFVCQLESGRSLPKEQQIRSMGQALNLGDGAITDLIVLAMGDHWERHNRRDRTGAALGKKRRKA